LLSLLSFCQPHKVCAQNWANLGTSDFSSGATDYTSMAIDGSGNVYVAFQDEAHSFKATVMKYNGTSWSTVGTAGFSSGRSYNICISLNASGTPYVAYMDAGHSYKATVMSFDGSMWNNVGAAGFTSGEAHYPALAIGSSGQIYISFVDFAHSQKASVMEFDGSSWSYVGSAGFSSGEVQFTSMTLDGSGNPYVVYQDWSLADKLVARKFDGSNWNLIGTEGFTPGGADLCSIVVNAAGAPYVCFRDYTNSEALAVMSYNGTSWSTVGSTTVSAGQVDWPSICLDASGNILVAYEDHTNSDKAVVRRFCSGAWSTLGATGLSPAAAYCTSIALDASGTPHIAYEDNMHSRKATVNKLTIPGIQGNNTICTGTPSSFADSATSGTWSISNSSIATIDPATGAVTALAAGTDTIYYNYAGIGTSLPVSIIQTPSALTVSGATTMCESATTVLTGSPTGGTWSTSGTLATISGGIVTGISAGNATVSYTVTNACGSATTTHNIEVYVHPYAGSISGSTSLCSGTTATLTDETAGGIWITSGAHTSVSGGVVTGISAGTDAAMYIVSNACAADTAIHSLTVVAQPESGTIAGASEACTGNVVDLWDGAPDGVWTSSDASVATVSGGVVTAAGYGNAIISYTVANGICSSVSTHAVSVYPTVIPSLSITADTIAATPGNVSFYVSETYGGTTPSFQWFINDEPYLTTTSGSVSAALTGDNTVYCVMTSSLPCAGPVSDTSNRLTIRNGNLSVADASENSLHFNIFPNPSQGAFTANVGAARTMDAIMIITDVLGNKVKEINAPTNTDIKIVLDAPAGVYLITATADGIRASSRVTIY